MQNIVTCRDVVQLVARVVASPWPIELLEFGLLTQDARIVMVGNLSTRRSPFTSARLQLPPASQLLREGGTEISRYH